MFLDYPPLYGCVAPRSDFDWNTRALLPKTLRVLVEAADHDKASGAMLDRLFLEQTTAASYGNVELS